MVEFNWHPTDVAFLDWETQSRCDLKGGRTKYFAHPSTVPLCVCVKRGDELRRFRCWEPGWREALSAFTEGATIVAHNADFDATAWEAFDLPSRLWYDTLRPARAAGFPGKLDELGQRLEGRGKDPNGKRLVDMLCVLRGPTPKPGPAHELLLDYCARDVALLETVYREVHGYGEPDVMNADIAVNMRGVPFIRERLERLKTLLDRNRGESRERFRKETDGVNPSSPKQVLEWLESHDLRPTSESMTEGARPSVNKNALARMMANPEEFYVGEGDADDAVDAVREAVVARKEAVGPGVSKVDTALEVQDEDGRIRDQYVYWGAHTGRWASRRLQMQNLPANPGTTIPFDIKKLPLEWAAVNKAAGECGIAVGSLLGQYLRLSVESENLLVADFAAVETRCLAWLAGDQRMLSTYTDPKKNIYIDFGESLFGTRIDKHINRDKYALCKAVVLGCGYGMSGFKFDYMRKMRGVSTEPLAAIGLTPQDAVNRYRETYSRVPALWQEAGEALHRAVGGSSVQCCRSHFYSEKGNLYIVLPSGRRMVFPDARVEDLVPVYNQFYGMKGKTKPTVTYLTPKGWRASLYSSKVVENVDQAICRDLLAEALVHCEQVGLHPILHSHDEIGCEAPESRFDEFMEILSHRPAWADGFPVAAEGYSGPVWTKDPAGYRQAKWMDGREV